MPACKIIIGQKFGKLTIIERLGYKKNTGMLWNCQCDCGGTRIVSSSKLTQGVTKCCGCTQANQRRSELFTKEYNSTHDAIIGKTFGMLTVMKFSHFDDRGYPYFLCQCECKKTKVVRKYYLTSKVVKHCGCQNTARAEDGSVKQHTIGDESMTLKEWCIRYNANYNTVCTKIHREKMTLEEALVYARDKKGTYRGRGRERKNMGVDC